MISILLIVTAMLLPGNKEVTSEVEKVTLEKVECMDRKVSEKGLEFIKRHESVMEVIYYCPGGVLTGGVGHALSPAERKVYKLGARVDPMQIDRWLQQDVSKSEKAVNTWVTRDIGQNQFDALVSFVFNVGVDSFKRSTLLKLINKGKFEVASKEFGKWIHSRGRKLPGLVTRRTQEMELFRKEMAEDVVV